MTTKTVVERLDRVLRPLGFARRRMTWNRKVASTIDVLDVQESKAIDSVTVNIGALDIEVYRLFWGSEPPVFVPQPLCTVGGRLGKLIDGMDVWWTLGQDAADEITDKVLTYGVPFLERMHLRAEMERWLINAGVTKKKYPAPIINLAILMALLNERERGCQLLADVETRPSGTWRTRAAEVATRLSCRPIARPC